MNRALSGFVQAVAGDGVILRIQLNAEILATEGTGSKEGRAGTSKGIEHQSVCWSEGGNQRSENAERFFGRVEFVAAIAPVEYIADDVFGSRVALRQQVGGFVLVAHMPGFGRVAFRENEVTDYPKSCGTEGG